MVRLYVVGLVLLLGACDGDGEEEAPVPEACAMAGWECGMAFDLDGPVSCGACGEGEICGLHSFNRCGRCEARTCADVGAECGTIQDGCGQVVTCGICAEEMTCGLYEPNLCGVCTPRTCHEQGAECGTVQDGCGGTLECGSCAFGTCKGQRCECHPDRCEPADCGKLHDGCGGTLDCGECPTASTIRTVPLQARDLAADPERGMIYASVPSSAGGQGNSIVVIDAATGAIERTFFVGSEPGAVAISSEGRRLWVGLDGSEAVVEIDLETDEVKATFPLGDIGFGGANRAMDILASPTGEDTVVVAVGNTSSAHSIAAYRNGRALGAPVTGLSSNGFTFSPDGATFYTAGVFGDLTIHTLGSNGLSSGETVRGLLGREVFEMVVAGGRLHCSNGKILDLSSRTVVGTLQADGRFHHDPAKAQSYFLPWTLSYYERAALEVFSTERFVPVDRVDLGKVEGHPRPAAIERYADGGLAILVEGEIWLVESDGI